MKTGEQKIWNILSLHSLLDIEINPICKFSMQKKLYFIKIEGSSFILQKKL